MKSIRKSLSSQMIVALLFLSIVPLSIIGSISFSTGRQIIIENVQTHLKTVGILKRHAIDKWVEHLEHSTLHLAKDFYVIRDVALLNRGDIPDGQRQSAYNSLMHHFQQTVGLGDIAQISLIDKSTGQIVVSSAPSWVGKFRDSAQYYISGKEAIYVSDIFLNLSFGRPTMVVSCPVRNSNGSLQAVLAVHANFEKLSEIMQERTGLSQTTETFLVNKGNLLITNTVFAPNGAFKKWIFGEGAIRALAGESDVGLFFDYREKEVIGAYFWLPDRKLALIAKQDVSEAFIPIADLKRNTLFVAFTLVLLVILAGFVAGHKIVTQIRKLVAGTVAVGGGDLDYRINSRAENEIGILSKAFDQMAESLQHITVSLDEKEILLREIHHRVKNNLQMVQSLLSLQIGQFTDATVIAPLKDSMHRITSIAMVHDTLYKSKDLSIIDLDSYFRDLVNYLMKSIRSTTSPIEVVCHIEQIPIKLDSVISCGLIINELVTNAMKYAFAEGESGCISINLSIGAENEAVLIVADNGLGVADLKTLTGKNTLGLDLVKILVENQLEGMVKIDNTHGLKYVITFPF